jgi:hypothetical protein
MDTRHEYGVIKKYKILYKGKTIATVMAGSIGEARYVIGRQLQVVSQ